MTTVVSVLDRIARQCSVKSPDSWVTASHQTHVEIRDDFFLDTVEDILEWVDLPPPAGGQVNLSSLTSSTNSDDSRTFELPTKFARLHKSGMAVYDAEQDRPCVSVPDDGVFSLITDTGATGVVHFYQLRGYEGNFTLTLYTDPGATADITVSYNTDNWMVNGAGVYGKALTADTDSLLFPRRLVESGAIARYRERRGLPYLDKWTEYVTLRNSFANKIRAINSVNMQGQTENIRWQDLVPSYIPPS